MHGDPRGGATVSVGIGGKDPRRGVYGLSRGSGNTKPRRKHFRALPFNKRLPR